MADLAVHQAAAKAVNLDPSAGFIARKEIGTRREGVTIALTRKGWHAHPIRARDAIGQSGGSGASKGLYRF